MRADFRAIAALLLLASTGAAADIYLTEGTNFGVDTAGDGRFAVDVLGSLWLVPPNGGEATALASGEFPAARPRWSPDDAHIAYESRPPGESLLRLYSVADGTSRALTDGRYPDRDPSWHPDGERIVFASARHGAGFDIWEVDIPTGLTWRLSRRQGNESEPAWSPSGRDLLYVHEYDGLWRLVLRRRGAPEEVLVASDRPIAAPSWRPDGTLVTYLEQREDGWALAMTILSEPRLQRTLIEGEDLFLDPVTWPDRQTMSYTANGKIRRRAFNSWTSKDVPFRARIGAPALPSAVSTERRRLPMHNEPSGRTVIRAQRLFDGLGSGYRRNQDVVIDGGRIDSIRMSASHDDAIVIDLGDVTVLPGFIDAYARLPDDIPPDLGPLLLSLGVTTVVADTAPAEALDEAWSGKDMPGPRVLRAARIGTEGDARPWLVTIRGEQQSSVQHRERVSAWHAEGVPVLADSWQVALGSGASLLLGTGARPTSPGGHSYQDVQLAGGSGAVTLVSGLADASTPGLESIAEARAANSLASGPISPRRRFVVTPRLGAAATSVVLGSLPNGLPPGLATHAELRALVAAGLDESQALKAAGVNAASALGLGLEVGRIATGAAADLVIVDGDPLNDMTDALNVIAIVRNGRFYSVSGLLERSTMAKSVE